MIRRVEVAVARRESSRRCRWLGAKRLGGRASCGAPVYRRARLGKLRNGKVPWTFRSRVRLPRGSYTVSVRAHDADGRVTSAAGRRYVTKRFRVR